MINNLFECISIKKDLIHMKIFTGILKDSKSMKSLIKIHNINQSINLK
jgi:hypothetical protein